MQILLTYSGRLELILASLRHVPFRSNLLLTYMQETLRLQELLLLLLLVLQLALPWLCTICAASKRAEKVAARGHILCYFWLTRWLKTSR